ncbi:MAG: hypothetical protein RLZZ241_1901 [Bacteroidota bacterium]|jgi:redox-sensitive bicupin YhaK (pirin superfamily)
MLPPMKKNLITAASRGRANFGWLNSYHSYSFGNYYNPERMQFGALRVLNDDRVAPGMGFDTHPHRNMEIISIGLEGELKHQDSMGNTAIIKAGDIQVMSAGSGITHSEYNNSKSEPVAFLQIWIFPSQANVAPRYDQISLKDLLKPNTWNLFLGPYGQYDGMWVYQNIWFHWGNFEAGQTISYALKNTQHGLFIFVIEGTVLTAGELLNQRDALELTAITELEFEFKAAATVLLMEVPLLA